MINIIGIKRVSEIFYNKINQKRCNFSPRTINMHREILNSAQNKLLKLLPSFIDIVVEFESDKKNIHNFLAEREVDLGIESNIKPLIKEKVICILKIF